MDEHIYSLFLDCISVHNRALFFNWTLRVHLEPDLLGRHS